MGKLLLLFMLGALLSACNPYAEYQARKTVQEQLKDPESARFSEMQVFGNGLLVCGQVNAKNSMGGYVGNRQFMIWSDSTFIASDDADSINLSTCCTHMKQAVAERKSSADVPGLEHACSNYMPDGFSWP